MSNRSGGVVGGVGDPSSPSARAGEEEAGGGKVKLLCSFGGRIAPRSGDGALRYVGGQMRLISVPRTASFGELVRKVFGVTSIRDNDKELMSALYLQVSIISQALIFVTRSRSWSFVERPGFLLVTAFFAAQLVATVIAVYAEWEFCRIQSIGWEWGGAIWAFSIVTYVPLDVLKFIIRYSLSGKGWDNIQNKTAFTNKKDYGKGEREAQWAVDQRTLHGLNQPSTSSDLLTSKEELSEIAELAAKRAEVARLRELHTLKGHVESVVKLKGLDIETIQQSYTV